MSRKTLRKRVRRLERELEQMFGIVTRLAANQHGLADCFEDVGTAVRAAVGEQAVVMMAIVERNEAARRGLQIKN